MRVRHLMSLVKLQFLLLVTCATTLSLMADTPAKDRKVDQGFKQTSEERSTSDNAAPQKTTKKKKEKAPQVIDKAQQGELPSAKFGQKFKNEGVRFTGGRFHDEVIPFNVKKPDSIEPGKKYPMVIWLHGHGPVEVSHEVRGKLNWVDKLFPEESSSPCYVMLPYAFHQEPWFEAYGDPKDRYPDGKGDEVLTRVREMIDHILEKYPNIDDQRITLIGLSSGAGGVWELAMRNPGLFAAIVPTSSRGGDITRVHNLKGTTVWAFQNKHDHGFPVKNVQRTVDACVQNGVDATLTVFDTRGHNSWSQAFKEKDLREWLLAQDRRKSQVYRDVVYQWNRIERGALYKGFGFFGAVAVIAIAVKLERKRHKQTDPAKERE